nr:MAG TPA: DNA polymerase [Caudoviricetes sp.]
MAGLLFNIPKRKEVDSYSIIKKTQEYVPPKINIRGTSLADRIRTIEENIIEHPHLLLNSDKKFVEYMDKALKREYCALDTETTGLDFQDQKQIVGLCIMGDGLEPAYVPVGHIDNITEELEVNQVSVEYLKTQLLRLFKSNVKLIYHNYYYDAVVLYFVCGIIPPIYFDTYPCSCLLNENESHSLKDLYMKYILEKDGEVDKFSELFNGIPFCNIPSHIGANYAAQDSKMTMDVFKFFLPFVTKGTPECEEYRLEKISDLLYDVEIPLLPILVDMKIRGIEFDFKRAKELHDKYTKLRDDAEDKLNSLTDIQVNFNSPAQVASLLYDHLKLPQIEERSTSAEVLEKIDHPVAKAIVEVKTYDKLLGTFIDKLTEQARNTNGKIHCNFNPCGTNTGRFSSNNPNLQNIPSQYGDIRNLFTAGDGNVFLSCDYSKQEIVVACVTADEDNLREAFHKNLDIYSHVASLAFKKPYEECLEHNPDGSVNKEGKKMRKMAKAVTLGIMYGKGTKATAEDLGIAYDEAQSIIDDVFTAFPKLAQEIKKTEEQVKKYGMVESISGRRRRLPDAQLPEYEFPTKDKYEIARLKAGIRQCRSFNDKMSYLARNNIKNNSGFIARALRQSYNSRIQGESSVMCKISMVKIGYNKELKNLGCKIILTIHDELLVSCPEENSDKVAELVVKNMIEAGGKCSEILKCDVEVMKNWG